MCGRFASNLTWEQLHAIYGIAAPEQTPAPPDLQPHYNVAPTQTVPVARLNRAGRREIPLLRWGVVPSWGKDAKIGARTINPPAEAGATPASFRGPCERRP